MSAKQVTQVSNGAYIDLYFATILRRTKRNMPRRKGAKSPETSQDESNQNLDLGEIHQHLKNYLDNIWNASIEQSDGFSNGLNEYRASLRKLIMTCSEYNKLIGQFRQFVLNMEEQWIELSEKLGAVVPLESNFSTAFEHMDDQFEQILSTIESDDRVQKQLAEGSRVQKDLEMYLKTPERSSHDRELIDKMAALIEQRQPSRTE